MCDSLESRAQPHVLLLATQPWPTGARLGLALHAVGFGVSIWSPSGHPLLKTDAADHHYPYGAVGQDSLERAILAANPDLIVPCDDPATARLQRLAARALTDSRLHRVLSVIERSLGPAADLNKLTERAYVLEVAAEGGVAVPANARLTSSADLRAWFHEYGFPAYLKADGTFGGVGVRPVHTYQQAESALRALHAPPGTLGAFKRLAIYGDPTLMGPWVRRERPAISVQRSVSGADVNSAIFCWQGQVLASISVKALATRYERGPSTVVRRIHNAAMDRAAKVLASRLKLSGFYGLDFILEGQGDEEQSGTPWLIEMNSRATQIAHLALGPGHDLAAAAYAAIGDVPVHPRRLVTTENTIALFPQEWERDPASPLIRSAYHDVPWDAPALVRAYVNQRPGLRVLSQQFWRERRQRKQSFEASTSSETAPRLP
jgi:hypothetical protein